MCNDILPSTVNLVWNVLKQPSTQSAA